MKLTKSLLRLIRANARCFTTIQTAKPQEAIVYLSRSNDVYKNLAFEDWIYDKVDLSKKRILFLWRNTPSVVIGRHQNPWEECNLPVLKQHDIKLARRKSGGGTVYHDLGNLNVTFFTHRSLYNRQENLNLIVKVLKERWQLDVKVSSRDDIVLENTYKISGTSSKLGRVTVYHHCTLLLNVDTKTLQDVLQPTYSHISTNATPSIKSKVKNLSTINPLLGYHDVAMAIAQEYNKLYTPDKEVELRHVDPSDGCIFPGIEGFTNELKSWKWLYGKTPKFELPLKTQIKFGDVEITFSCYHGIINNVSIATEIESLSLITDIISTSLKGRKFCPQDISAALEELQSSSWKTSCEKLCVRELSLWLAKVL